MLDDVSSSNGRGDGETDLMGTVGAGAVTDAPVTEVVAELVAECWLLILVFVLVVVGGVTLESCGD